MSKPLYGDPIGGFGLPSALGFHLPSASLVKLCVTNVKIHAYWSVIKYHSGLFLKVEFWLKFLENLCQGLIIANIVNKCGPRGDLVNYLPMFKTGTFLSIL